MPQVLLRIIQIFLFLGHVGFSHAMTSGQLGPKTELFKPDIIEFSGLKKVEQEAILDRIQSKPSIMLDNYLLRSDIEKIYSLKYFDQVEAHKEIKEGKNVLIFKLHEKPIVQTIRFQGNDGESMDTLKEKIKTKTMSILDVNTIKNDVQALTKHYEEKGFYLANVDFEVNPIGPETVELVFKINEYDKVKVKKISFLGNKSLTDAELKKFMQTREEGFLSFMSSAGNFKEADFQIDVERLNYLYKSKGHLQINVSPPIVTVSQDKRWIFITITVNEGPKFSVNTIKLEGDLDVLAEEKLREKIGLKEGETYSEDQLRKDIQALTELYQDEGYAFANVIRTLEPVPGENKVDIHFNFEKGKIVYFGDIVVKGNTKTRDKVVRRELRIWEGMKYSGSKMRESKENVTRLGYFENESVIFNTVAPKGRDDILNLEISVKERQTGQISLGAGYSSAYSMFIQASISQNNFLGKGLMMNADFQKSGLMQETWRFGLTDPYFNDTRWTVGGDVYKTRSNFIRALGFKKQGFDYRMGYPIVDYTRLFVTYRFETTDVFNVQDPTVKEDLERGTSSTIQASILRDRRNNIFEPTKGYYISAGMDYTGVGGSQRWVKADIDTRIYRPIIGDLVFRARLWVSQFVRTTDRGIPRSEKFSLGGPRNMRGYNINDVGPRENQINKLTGLPDNFNTGGQGLILGMFELEHPLVREANLKWALFYDTGNVFSDYIGKNRNFALRSDYGFGFRWISPIGVLRFEFGYPINKKPNEQSQQFNFDIGQLF